MAKKGKKVGVGQLPYKRNKSILSAAELAFYRVLIKSIDSGYIICPKVRLGDVFSVPQKKDNVIFRYKINQKHVDFLLCVDSTMSPVLGIELDDSTHERRVRQERDQFVDDVYEVAGLPLLHIRATATYDSKLVASLVNEAICKKISRNPINANIVNSPLCPKCAVKMRLRWNKKGRKHGDAFWECPNFRACNQIVAT